MTGRRMRLWLFACDGVTVCMYHCMLYTICSLHACAIVTCIWQRVCMPCMPVCVCVFVVLFEMHVQCTFVHDITSSPMPSRRACPKTLLGYLCFCCVVVVVVVAGFEGSNR